MLILEAPSSPRRGVSVGTGGVRAQQHALAPRGRTRRSAVRPRGGGPGLCTLPRAVCRAVLRSPVSAQRVLPSVREALLGAAGPAQPRAGQESGVPVQTIGPVTRGSQAAPPAAGIGESRGVGHCPALTYLQTGRQSCRRALCLLWVCSPPQCPAPQGLLATVTTKGCVKHPLSKLIVGTGRGRGFCPSAPLC